MSECGLTDITGHAIAEGKYAGATSSDRRRRRARSPGSAPFSYGAEKFFPACAAMASRP